MVAVETAFSGEFLIGSLIQDAGRIALMGQFPEHYDSSYPDLFRFAPELHTITADAFHRILNGIKADPNGQPAIEAAAAAISRYGDFESHVTRLERDIPAGKVRTVGAGVDSWTYKITAGSNNYAANIPRPQPLNISGSTFNLVDLLGGPDRFMSFKTASKATALAYGHGLENAQQLVAYSANENVCLSEWVDGKGAHTLYVDDLPDIRPKDIRQYVHTIAQLANRGLTIDYGLNAANPSNILWHSDNGFTVIDYNHRQPTQNDLRDSMHVLVKSLICPPDSFNNTWQSEDPLKYREAQNLLSVLGDQAYSELGVAIALNVDQIDQDIRSRR